MKVRLRHVAAGLTILASITALELGGSHSAARAAVPAHQSAAGGGASRTWVSGVGDDTNPCSRTAPCKTFAGAFSKTGTNSEIDTLDPGGFGGVTINRAVTIDGLGGNKSSVLVSGTNGIVVNAAPNDVVTLRHLQIQGVGGGLDGIKFISGKALILDDVVIEGFTGNGFKAALTTDNSSLIIRNSRIVNNGQAGVAITTTTGHLHAAISDSELSTNHDGLFAGSGAIVDVNRSVLASNTAVGAGCDTSGPVGCTLNVSHDQIDSNGSGVSAARAANNDAPITIWLSDDDIYSNTTGIARPASATGIQVLSFGNNRIMGNGTNGTPNARVPQS